MIQSYLESTTWFAQRVRQSSAWPCVGLAVRAHRSDREESEGEQAEKYAPTRLRAAKEGERSSCKKKEKKKKENTAVTMATPSRS